MFEGLLGHFTHLLAFFVFFSVGEGLVVRYVRDEAVRWVLHVRVLLITGGELLWNPVPRHFIQVHLSHDP
jgi:hypothetical protein